MAQKPGYRTTEFWLTAILNIAGAVVAILVARNMLTQEEADLWLALVQAIAVAAIPAAIAYATASYTRSRTALKITQIPPHPVGAMQAGEHVAGKPEPPIRPASPEESTP